MKLIKKFKEPAGPLQEASKTFGVDTNGYIYYVENGVWTPTQETYLHYRKDDSLNPRDMSLYPIDTIQVYGPGTLFVDKGTNGFADGISIIKPTSGTVFLDASTENGRRNNEAAALLAAQNDAAWEKTKNYSNDFIQAMLKAASAPLQVTNVGGLIRTGQDLANGEDTKAIIGSLLGGLQKLYLGDSWAQQLAADLANNADLTLFIGGGKATTGVADFIGTKLLGKSALEISKLGGRTLGKELLTTNGLKLAATKVRKGIGTWGEGLKKDYLEGVEADGKAKYLGGKVLEVLKEQGSKAKDEFIDNLKDDAIDKVTEAAGIEGTRKAYENYQNSLVKTPRKYLWDEVEVNPLTWGRKLVVNFTADYAEEFGKLVKELIDKARMTPTARN